MNRRFEIADEAFIRELQKWSVPILRISLAAVFLWFGLLKLFGATPVTDLIRASYPFVPTGEFILVLGIWEAAIGLGLLFQKALRTTLALLWLQMAGTLFSLILNPALFFQNGNPLLLTLEGEFLIKNLVLVAASLVVGGFEVPRRRS